MTGPRALLPALALLAGWPAGLAAQTEPEVEPEPPAAARDVVPQPYLHMEVRAPESIFAQSRFVELVAPRSSLDRAGLKSVVDAVNKPDMAGGALAVCFVDAPDDLVKRRVAQAARAWQLPGTSIKFDFGPNASRPQGCGETAGDIRISFARAGTWSVIGRASAAVEKTLPTMNFDSQGGWSMHDPADFARIVQHEFGHALGFFHEHQNPHGDCSDQIDWPTLEKLLGAAPYHLPPATIRENFQKLVGDYDASSFDEKSIMLYDLDRRFFVQKFFENNARPNCFHDRNWAISDGDKAAARKHFPPSLRDLMKLRLASFARYREMLEETVPDPSDRQEALWAAGVLYPFEDGSDAEPFVEYVQDALGP